MSNNTKRVVATLDNGQTIFCYNQNPDARLEGKIILAGQPEAKETEAGSQYRFSNADSGWFASINATDMDRLSAVLQVKSGEIVVRINPLKTFEEKDLKGAKAFVPAGDSK